MGWAHRATRQEREERREVPAPRGIWAELGVGAGRHSFEEGETVEEPEPMEEWSHYGSQSFVGDPLSDAPLEAGEVAEVREVEM